MPRAIGSLCRSLWMAAREETSSAANGGLASAAATPPVPGRCRARARRGSTRAGRRRRARRRARPRRRSRSCRPSPGSSGSASPRRRAARARPGRRRTARARGWRPRWRRRRGSRRRAGGGRRTAGAGGARPAGTCRSRSGRRASRRSARRWSRHGRARPASGAMRDGARGRVPAESGPSTSTPAKPFAPLRPSAPPWAAERWSLDGSCSWIAVTRPPRSAGGTGTLSTRSTPFGGTGGRSCAASPPRVCTTSTSCAALPVMRTGSVSSVAERGIAAPASATGAWGRSRRASSAGDCEEKSPRQPCSFGRAPVGTPRHGRRERRAARARGVGDLAQDRPRAHPGRETRAVAGRRGRVARGDERRALVERVVERHGVGGALGARAVERGAVGERERREPDRDGEEARDAGGARGRAMQREQSQAQRHGRLARGAQARADRGLAAGGRAGRRTRSSRAAAWPRA